MKSKLRQSCQNCVGLRGVAVRKIRVGDDVGDHDIGYARVREVEGKGGGRAFVIRRVDLNDHVRKARQKADKPVTSP